MKREKSRLGDEVSWSRDYGFGFLAAGSKENQRTWVKGISGLNKNGRTEKERNGKGGLK